MVIVAQAEMVPAMNDRRQRIIDRLAESQGDFSTVRLCGACSDITAMTGAGIMLRLGDESLGAVGMTDAVSTLIEELQFTLGEGPCIDAYELEIPIVEPDLTAPSRRWPGFTPPALEAGVRAVFSFPLQAGDVCIGALDLYRDTSGELSDVEHADASTMTEVVAQAVLTMQATPWGAIAAELTIDRNRRSVVHQAVGMVSVQLGVTVDEALLRLRAHAFANDRPLAALAREVVERRVRFDPTVT